MKDGLHPGVFLCCGKESVGYLLTCTYLLLADVMQRGSNNSSLVLVGRRYRQLEASK